MSPIYLLKEQLKRNIQNNPYNLDVAIDSWFSENVLEFGVCRLITDEMIISVNKDVGKLKDFYKQVAGKEIGMKLIETPNVCHIENWHESFYDKTNYRVFILKVGDK